MRILIFGINYAPEETGVAPYTTGMAEHFVDIGHKVSVVTGVPHYPTWHVEAPYKSHQWTREEIRGVEVFRARHYVPSTQSAFRRGLYEVTYLLNSLRSLRVEPPDAILGVVPSLSGAVLARLASRRFEAPYGVLFQDLMGPAALESGVSGNGRVGTLVRSAERWAVARARAVGVIANGFRSYLQDLGLEPEKIVRVRNWTHVERARTFRTSTRRKFGLPENAFVCLHAGNMGHKQALENLIDCARLSMQQGDSFQFVLIGDGNRRAKLQELTQDYGLSNTVFLPIQPREDFMSLLAAADVLLINQKGSVVDMSLPSKLTSYFMAGRPVIAAASACSETATEIKASGAGLLVAPDDPSALHSAIVQLADNLELSSQLGSSGVQYARRHLSAEAALATCESLLQAISGQTDVDTPLEVARGVAA